jgi:hypothetical protein
MFVLTSIESLGKAVENARRLHPKVRAVRFGEYRVTGSGGDAYTVRCYREGGHKVVDCDCEAGKLGRPCKHSAAALALHLYWAARRAGQG